MGVEGSGDARDVASRRKAYRSGSFSAKTFLLVWSRMTLILMKQPRSSFFERNIDIMAVAWELIGVSTGLRLMSQADGEIDG